MFRRLLVANRGEVACRVIRTARRLGIHTIAVYSDADASARHVRLADEAWRLGPAPPRESYLSVPRILEVARAAGAEAIHPGYGFLSERAEFAAACVAAGIAFVGPPAAAMAAMGSKSAAKAAMQRAGVPVLPGYHGPAQSLAELEAEALAVGFPLIVKPSGGGGGKGMQIVDGPAGLGAALAAARRLAESAFGDPTLLIERYVPAPRHVEVQVLCDAHGNALHLHTRDCSVQRRHQKLLEEAPAPGIAAEVRARLHGAGLAVARAVGYVNAGTIEFLYADGEFWFMEMNTRLQVEHCVTEQVFGIDLVEWQLRIAAGERLPFAQDALEPAGHAIEARVCAEDPARDFAPSVGRLGLACWPDAVPQVRVDAGFEQGDEVPSHYDSLLGKVIGYGADRAAALAALAAGLAKLRLAGVASNAGWLAAAVGAPSFQAGGVSTRFVQEHGAQLGAPPSPGMAEFAAAACEAAGLLAPPPPLASPWESRDAFRVNLPARQDVTLRHGEVDHRLALTREGVAYRLAVDGSEARVVIERGADGASLEVDGVRVPSLAWREGAQLSVWRGAARFDFRIVDPRAVDVQSAAHEGELIARLPGTVVAVAVAVGQAVAAGETLMVLEAMKMEHSVLAPRAGTVSRIHFQRGDRVPEGAVLVDLDGAATA
jgi:3-methylcrotonyl-CoA carboxylase alpha subunit